jgi:uncharacterized lipoprotein YmbA
MIRAREAGGRALTLASVLICSLLTIAAGCSTPPQERFFTLESPPASQPAANTGAGDFLIVVGPITVPEMVDRPQIVLRTAPGRVEIAEQARWAAPLKSEIPRVVADHLGRLLDGARTAAFAERASGTPDYRVLIDIQRFESVPQQGATIQASWTVRTPSGEPLIGRSIVSEPAGSGYDELVAAHSRALGAISRDIAAAIQASRARKP